MKRIKGAIAFCGLLAGLISGGVVDAPSAVAQSFYKGKTIKMIVRSAPGGGYDFYGRLVARHLGKHIPGKPDVIVINMPGAGGIVAANYIMNRAKRNGTEIAILTRELALAQRTGEVGVKYDLRELSAIGSAASSTFLVVLGKNQPIKTYEQLRKSTKPVLFAATGPGAGSYQYPALLKNDGFNVKIITGILGGQARFLSIERGEVNGTANSYESTAKAIDEFGLIPIFYSGAEVPALKGVPHINTQLTAEGKQLAALLGAPLAAGRPFFSTPNTPANRLKILRAAFKATLEDPQLLKEAERAKRNVAWTAPSVMDGINRDILSASDKVIALYNEGAKKPKQNLSKFLKHLGPVTQIKDKGRKIWIDHKGKEVMAKISGSRTKITLGGKTVKRKAIKVGMNCQFTYPKPGAEAVMVDCK
ncbi:MAG: tripartite tricarboxylate transporter substrate-binding protein [Proteobacteria bacterium]|nr:tripartite tricarboxylate transporter substrate-binding protein [Pseudomonadota bacterium]